jgi:TPR repeat protein
MYDNGRGVVQSDAEAVKWYRKAADQGNVSAQLNLGFMYGNGRGVAQSDAEAVKWHRKAAQQGDQEAKDALKRLGKAK